MYDNGRSLLLPGSLGPYRGPTTYHHFQLLSPIDRATQSRLKAAAQVFQDLVRKYLLPETLELIGQHLERIAYLVTSPYSGDQPDSLLGYSLADPNFPICLALALSEPGRPRKFVELAEILCHEVVHIVDPAEEKLDYEEYRDTLEAIIAYEVFVPEPETLEALKDPKETGARLFTCALFGEQFTDVDLWRYLYSEIVQLVERDQLTLFHI